MGGWQDTRAVILALCLGACAQETQPQTAAAEPADADAGVVSEIVGVATISSGDTIRIGPRRVRFDGIATPRPRAMCGEVNAQREATNALRRLIRSSEVRCAISDLPDAQGRDIARCRVGETDIAAQMVADGWARDTPAQSDGAYAEEEAAARAGRRGVWGLACTADPWPAE
ncbi:MAG TPA: thermonuclease family protein [Candidatus Binatia bacterium]|nr:thermonuclease family protein [Candidatus Binatia bacterium]